MNEAQANAIVATLPVSDAATTPAVVVPPQPAPLAQANPDITSAESLGVAFGRSALREAGDITTFCISVCHYTGATKTPWVCPYPAFVLFREAFKRGAVAAGYSAADQLWSRTWKAGMATGMIGDMPKASATDKAAAQKQGKRTDAKAKADAIVAEITGKTPAQIVALTDAALKSGDTSRAAALLVTGQKLKAQAESEAKKATREACKAQADVIAAAIKRLTDAGNVVALQKLATAALKASPAPVAVVGVATV